MIIQRLSKGIKDQDWFVVMVEVMIVVVGVYMGIFIGEAATQRNLEKDAHASLELLIKDLKSDQEYLGMVIDMHRSAVANYKHAINSLKTDPLDLEQATAAIMKLETSEGQTFYPNGSTYQVMLSKGQLDALGDTNLRQKITKLYEMSYIRSQENGLFIGRNTDAINFNIIAYYFDSTTNSLIATSPADLARFRAGLYNQHDYIEWYLGEMIADVKVPMDDLNSGRV